MDALDAQTITSALLALLAKHGFNEKYLKANLIGACSDGASTMLGSRSRVLTRLKQLARVQQWHCMCHRIELAIGDSVKDQSEINHMQIFMDKLYTLCSTSPRMQRELESCSEDLCDVISIWRVLGTRWCASSRRALQAIWQNYPALAKHFADNLNKPTFSGLHRILTASTFLKNLALMLDAFNKSSIVVGAIGAVSTTAIPAIPHGCNQNCFYSRQALNILRQLSVYV